MAKMDNKTDKTRHGTSFSTLSLPYTTEKDANRIRNYVKSNKMPIRLVFTPGKTLKKIFCKSRPYDTSTSVLGNPERCTICPIIANGTCDKRGAVYELVCRLCTTGDMKYQGEADRPVHFRIQEHLRAASNPLSYPNNAMGQHYSKYHHNFKPSLEVSILDIQQHTTKRKLSEAIHIHKNKPNLNDKSELENIVKYIT